MQRSNFFFLLRKKERYKCFDAGYFSTFVKHWAKYYLYKELHVLANAIWSHSAAGTALCADTGVQRVSARSAQVSLHRKAEVPSCSASKLQISPKPLLAAGARHP